MIKKVTANLSANIFAAILCLAFFSICFNYSSKINLWGDEASSLQLAEKSWYQIFSNFDVHLPTYHFFLKILISLFSDSNEIVLRLFHSILFSLGLFWGYKTILLLSQSPKKSLLVLFASIISPSFVFYATNLRMYSLLFLFSMWYIFKLSTIIVKNELPIKKEYVIYFITSSCLILTDYPGVAVFLIGSILIFLRFFKLRKFNYIFLSLSPIASLLIYSFHLIPAISNILTWPTHSGPTINIGKASISELAKWSYNSFRPVFDLFYPSQKILLLALIIPVFFAFGLFLSLLFFLMKRNKQPSFNVFIVACFSFYWLISIPSGHSLTRAFLPSLFFMPVFLILAHPWLPSTVAKLNKILFAFLILTNFFQALNPTFRLHSIIPYSAIASDSLLITEKENINHIFLSDNSLNNLSIKRYIEKGNHSQLDISWISQDFKFDLLNKGDFLFVSHMGENNKFF